MCGKSGQFVSSCGGRGLAGRHVAQPASDGSPEHGHASVDHTTSCRYASRYERQTQ